MRRERPTCCGRRMYRVVRDYFKCACCLTIAAPSAARVGWGYREWEYFPPPEDPWDYFHKESYDYIQQKIRQAQLEEARKDAKPIRFKPECVEWIKRGVKRTTFRFRRLRAGVYELVEGPLFKPRRLGVLFSLIPWKRAKPQEVIELWYEDEGPFSSPDEFVEWLKKVGLYERFKEDKVGWIHKVSYLGDVGEA